jgi:hypothetical protein
MPPARFNFEFNSNEIDINDLHREKHDSQITATEAGGGIDLRALARKSF